MKKLTSVLSDTWRGLIQRRLWPVAVLLLAALVALPMVMLRDPEPVEPAAGQAAADAAELSAQPLVAVASAEERDRVRRVLGARKDPFKPSGQPKRRKDRDDAGEARVSSDRRAQGSPTSGAAPTSGSPAAPGSGGGSYVSPAPVSPGSGPETTPKRRTRPAGSLSVRWGTTGEEALEKLEVERLDPLPTADEPLLVYLGLTDDGRSAVFMLDAGVTVDGDGRCRPDPDDCQTVELAAGETGFIEIAGEDGQKTQYQLDVVKIHGRRAASTRTPEKTAAVEARATRRALRSLGHAVPTYRFDARTGTLERTDAGD
jgi:hypothetical protein